MPDPNATENAQHAIETATRNWEWLGAFGGGVVGFLASRFQLGRSSRQGSDDIVDAIRDEGTKTRASIDHAFDRLQARVDDVVRGQR